MNIVPREIIIKNNFQKFIVCDYFENFSPMINKKLLYPYIDLSPLMTFWISISYNFVNKNF